MKDIGHFSRPAPAPKNKAEDGTAFLPSNPSCRAVRHNFFEIATKKKNGGAKRLRISFKEKLFGIFGEKCSNFK